MGEVALFWMFQCVACSAYFAPCLLQRAHYLKQLLCHIVAVSEIIVISPHDKQTFLLKSFTVMRTNHPSQFKHCTLFQAIVNVLSLGISYNVTRSWASALKRKRKRVPFTNTATDGKYTAAAKYLFLAPPTWPL